MRTLNVSVGHFGARARARSNATKRERYTRTFRGFRQSSRIDIWDTDFQLSVRARRENLRARERACLPRLSVRQIMRCYRFGDAQRRGQQSSPAQRAACARGLPPVRECVMHSSRIYRGFSSRRSSLVRTRLTRESVSPRETSRLN